MVFITQLIYIKEGQESVFNQFEDIVIPIIQKYNGQLLLRMRPSAKEIVESHIENPYEVHLIIFDSNEDFDNFLKDEERQKFLHLKEQSITSSVLVKGHQL